jgi:hypothetical protein
MRRNMNWVWLFLSLMKDNLGFGVLFVVFCFSLSFFCFLECFQYRTWPSLKPKRHSLSFFWLIFLFPILGPPYT